MVKTMGFRNFWEEPGQVRRSPRCGSSCWYARTLSKKDGLVNISVVPAKAGDHFNNWIPVFTGMTNWRKICFLRVHQAQK